MRPRRLALLKLDPLHTYAYSLINTWPSFPNVVYTVMPDVVDVHLRRGCQTVLRKLIIHTYTVAITRSSCMSVNGTATAMNEQRQNQTKVNTKQLGIRCIDPLGSLLVVFISDPPSWTAYLSWCIS